MPSTTAPNSRSGSTRWEWRRVKIVSPPKAPTKNSPEGPAVARRAPWDPREPLTLLVKYRGGAEAWYEIKARGRTYRFPGHVYLHDAMLSVYEDSRPTP